jgi:predicted NUDIX family NTP pyrophosphohydrolase
VLAAARREFREEIGQLPDGPLKALSPCRQPSGKIVMAWAVEGDIDPASVASNDFEMEWPPRSGRMQRFLEIDRAAWFPLPEARRRIQPGQVPLLDGVERLLKER